MKKAILLFLSVFLLSTIAYESEAHCGAPTNITFTTNSDGSITVSWTSPFGSTGTSLSINGQATKQVLRPGINSFTYLEGELMLGDVVCVTSYCLSGSVLGTGTTCVEYNCGYTLALCPDLPPGEICDYICILDPAGNQLQGINESVLWTSPSVDFPTGGCNSIEGYASGTVFEVDICVGWVEPCICEQTLTYTVPLQGEADSYSEENDNYDNSSEVSVYPNPTNSVVNITSSKDQNLSIEIYNTSGQKLLVQTANETSSTSIDVSDLSNGLHLMHIRDLDTKEYITIEKLMILK